MAGSVRVLGRTVAIATDQAYNDLVQNPPAVCARHNSLETPESLLLILLLLLLLP